MSAYLAAQEKLLAQLKKVDGVTDTSFESDVNPSENARNCLYHVLSFGRVEAIKPCSVTSHSVDGFVLAKCWGGNVDLVLTDETLHMHRGDACWVECHSLRQVSSDADAWSISWIRFDGPSVREYFELYRSTGQLNVSFGEERAIFLQLMKRVAANLKNQTLVSEIDTSEQIVRMLGMLCKIHAEHGGGLVDAPQAIRDAMSYMADHFAERVSLEMIANAAQINKFRLSRQFHEIVGITVGQYLTNLRIQHACNLLKYTNLSIAHIGELSGMPNPSRFTMVFRELQGITPSAYRKKWGELVASQTQVEGTNYPSK